MHRFVDELGNRFSYEYILYHGGRIDTVCPVCRSLAHVYKEETGEAAARCTKCTYRAAEEPSYRYSANGVCSKCALWFNEELLDKRQFTQKYVHHLCPHCSSLNQVSVHRVPTYRSYHGEIRQGREPIFKLELYFLAYFKGKPVWAMNREHLNYLLAYISADIRQKPTGPVKRTPSYSLPKYMKEAKNREAMVKILNQLQRKGVLQA
ncbi:hypothetical protein DCC85_04955 [Paenibacillus sp. CAA11]|uniref:hypothetical protein n=1 Tax=Paenibacillus sp. CAA11 TaxID=1532905 RepID=UPI000D341470|nr:hypothetical protein [Paenibacillus sp. CAA11]AWB43636.1 hypothetical protein DCC85_04955 [Paenibacillus sp. CAA11]